MQFDTNFVLWHFGYNRWANDKILGAAGDLTNDELNRYLYTSHHGILGTLDHIHRADRIWMNRLQGGPRLTLKDFEDQKTLESLEGIWLPLLDQWRDWVSTADLDGTLNYVNLAGKAASIKIWQLVLHLVNHSSYHRGQVITMVRQLGHTPVQTDLSAYVMLQPHAQPTAKPPTP
jgi:uncharacterized damage-inducible protein DinB